MRIVKIMERTMNKYRVYYLAWDLAYEQAWYVKAHSPEAARRFIESKKVTVTRVEPVTEEDYGQVYARADES